MPSWEHTVHASDPVACFVITTSDTRTEADDVSGRLIRELLTSAGHPVVGHAIVKNEARALRQAVEQSAPLAKARTVVVSGGTGIGTRDITVETLASLFDKRLEGFGEIFRALSFQEIGSAAMMSRALAGVYRDMIVFALPGSPEAARLALTRLILPELGHAIHELDRARPFH